MARWKPFPIIGGAYSDDCKPWSAQDTVNYIPVMAEKSGTRSREMLRCLPGYTTFCDLGTNAPIRGARNVEGRLFVVSGQTLFSVSPTGASTVLGTIPGVQRCSLSHNQVAGGNQVAISNGQAGYVYDTAKSTLVQITDEGFPGAICFDSVDGYITGIDPSRHFAFISDLADATSYNTLDEFQAEGSPDLLRGQAVTHRELWLMGERTIEPFVDTGAGTGTFQRAQGTVIEVGLAATHAVAVIDNSVIWLGNDNVLYRANGYTPTRISTHAMEQAFARCNTSQAFMFTFEDRGHKVAYLTFPDGQTWGYDAATGEVHRRQSYGLGRWRINTLTFWNGQWIAGDFNNGKLYALDWDVQHEDGAILERRRITGAFHDSQNNVIVNAMELVADTGIDEKSIARVSALSLSGSLPDGTVDDIVSFNYVIAASDRPITVAISSGALPSGLSIDNSGKVSGTLTVDGTFTWTVRVTDSLGNTRDLADSAVISAVLAPQLGGWKYLVTTLADATSYAAAAFDDRGWSTGSAPFGYHGPNSADVGGAAHTFDSRFSALIATTVPLDQSVWLRRTMTLKSVPAAGLRLIGYFDNSYSLYVNGALVSDGSTITNAGVNTVLSASGFVVGANVIAIRCNDDSAHASYDASYFDFLLDLV